MYCIKCGKQLDEKEMFCRNCGTKRNIMESKASADEGQTNFAQDEVQSQVANTSFEYINYNSTAPKRKKKYGKFIGIGIALLAVIAGIVIFFMLNSDKNEEIKESIAMVSAGSEHIVSLKEDGTVVAVGDNRDNQCDVSDWNLLE